MIEVIPGINEKSIEEIQNKLDLLKGVSEWVHIDISDNTLFPAETVHNPEVLKDLIANSSHSFEAHLMVANPTKYVRPLADAGFKRLIAHVECSDPRRFLEEAHFESIEVGMAIDGPTQIEELEPLLDELDVVLVMTIEAGPSGQPFLPETVDKIRTLHQNLPDLPIAVDGGIAPETAPIVKDAGATRLVSTSFLFRDPRHIGEAINRLQK